MSSSDASELLTLLLVRFVIYEVAFLVSVDDLIHLLLPDKDHVNNVSLIRSPIVFH